MKKLITSGVILALLYGTITTVFALIGEENPTEQVPITSFAQSSEEGEPPLDKEIYELYSQYKLIYNEKTEKLYYDGKLVRCFDDLTEIDENNTIGIEYYCEEGVVDVSALRDEENIKQNPDGSQDLRGELIGLRLHTEKEFSSRDLTDINKRSNTDTAVASSGNIMTADELEKLYGEYKPFGVTYDKETDTLFFENQPVRTITDILMSNSGNLFDGSFSGSLRNAGSKDGGTIDLYTIRDFSKINIDGHGTLTGIEKYSQEDFERHTNAVWYESK